MPRTFKYLSFLLCAAGVLYSAIALAQWDVTDDSSGSLKDQFKNKQKFNLNMDNNQPVEMQADTVQYSAEDSKAKASGNVVVKQGATTLRADQIELDRGKQVAHATGNVYLDSQQFQVDADAGTFSFTEKTGEFENARIWDAPLQVKGRSVAKVAEDHMVMEDGYMTTCDLDEPHFRMQAKRMDIWPGNKAVARGVKVYLGNVPVMYLARYTQDLKNKPWFTFFPGYKKDLGYFLLTRSRIKINDYLTTTILLDAYERQGFGWGTESKYRTPGVGEGLVRTYFINERAIAAKHPWQMKTEPTVQNERYRLEWRHKWDIDDNTNAIWQYYRLSDNVILPKYFERESRRDPTADTYFLLTRAMPVGIVSFRVDHRVNRFVSAVDRTPEVNYTVTGLPIGESGFYLQSNSTASNLVLRQPSPTEDRRKTMRVDTDNEISYPAHVAFVQVTPKVGGDFTYYSRTISPVHPTDVLRGDFRTGADLSTRFFKVFNLNEGLWGSNLTKLRHIVAPSVGYLYQHAPTFGPTNLNQFDSAIDGLDKQHVINFSLENKLQGKHGKDQAVDLVRLLTTVPYTIKQKGVDSGLGFLQNLLEITPNDRLRFVADVYYNTRRDRLEQSNLDFYVKATDNLGFNIGDSFVRKGDHQLVTQVAYKINPKWRFRVYERVDPRDFTGKEQGLTITRDLHEWEMSFIYNQVAGSGNEVLVTFNLKAFPEQPFDLFGTSFHERKAGSQSEVVTP